MSWQDFDLDGKLRVPIGYNLTLLYLLRGYVLWVVSLTYSEDRSLILSLVYPSHTLFVFTLLVGLPALIAFFLLALKSFVKSKGYQLIWQSMPILVVGSLILDVTIQGWGVVTQTLFLHPVQIIQLIVGVYVLWYWLRSRRIKRFFQLWLDQ